MKLICFPHAGGLSYYYTFLAKAKLCGIDEIFLFEYPMRAARTKEPHYRNFDEMAASAASDLVANGWCEGDYILFGHSMGAFAAFETAKVLMKDYGRPPKLVIISGQKPPCDVDPEHYRMCEAEGIAFLKKLGGIPDDMMRYPDAMKYFVELCRADLRVLQTYAPPPPSEDTLLPCGLVLYGREDIEFPPESLVHWREYFRYTHEIREFEGNHFYLNDHKEELVSYLNGCLKALFPLKEKVAAE